MSVTRDRADELAAAAVFTGARTTRAVIDAAVGAYLDGLHATVPGFTEAVTSARAHRLVAETERWLAVHDSTTVDSADAVAEDEATGVSGESLGSDHSPEQSVHDESAALEPGGDVSEDGAVAGDGAPVEASASEPDEAEHRADFAEPVGSPEPEAAPSPVDTANTTPGDDAVAGDEGPGSQPDTGWALLPQQDARHVSGAEGPSQPDRPCPYSGLTILRCKRSDLCDCFDFPEHDRALMRETT